MEPMHIKGIPKAVHRDKVVSFIRDIGIDPNTVLNIDIGHYVIKVHIYAMSSKGTKLMDWPNEEPLTHTISIPIEGESSPYPESIAKPPVYRDRQSVRVVPDSAGTADIKPVVNIVEMQPDTRTPAELGAIQGSQGRKPYRA